MHVIAEGKGVAPSSVGAPAVFFCSTLAIQHLHGVLSLPVALGLHSALLALGFASGYAVVALGGGADAAAALPSPIKWQQKRGFPARADDKKKP